MCIIVLQMEMSRVGQRFALNAVVSIRYADGCDYDVTLIAFARGNAEIPVSVSAGYPRTSHCRPLVAQHWRGPRRARTSSAPTVFQISHYQNPVIAQIQLFWDKHYVC